MVRALKKILLKRGSAEACSQIRRGPDAKDRRGRWTFEDSEFWRTFYGVGKRTWSSWCGLDPQSYQRRLREPRRTMGLDAYRVLRLNLYSKFGALPLDRRYRTL